MQSYANNRTTGKEQYYTNSSVVDLCLKEVQRHVDLSGKTILEPCGGTGEFIEGFRRIGIPDDKIISIDIEPGHPMVKLGDYLETDFSQLSGVISITNPPFGRASSLAKKFFNHAADHCNYICYLIPKAWRKWTTHNSLDKRFHLVADIEMPKDCFYLSDRENEKKGVLNTVFQIWGKRDYKRRKIVVPDHKLIQKIIPVSKDGQKIIKGANFSIVAFGHSCGRCEEITEPIIPYKTTTMYLNVKEEKVKEALRTVDLSKYYNNVSYVQALSIQEINYELNERFGLENYNFEEDIRV
jgi:predicted RNA methylase